MPGDRPSLLNEHELLSVLDHISEGVYFVDSERRVLHWNQGAEKISGYGATQVVGRCCGEFLAHVDECGAAMCGEACPLTKVLETGRPVKSQSWVRHRDGHRVPVSIEAVPFADPATGQAGVVEVFRDISRTIELLDRAKALEELAYIDPLTQLGNRRFAQQVLNQSWDEWRRNRTGFGVAMLDLDHFKAVNDRYGHAAGDEVLRVISRTLAGSLRSFDFLGRWGGEEILAIVRSIRPAELTLVAERFLAQVRASGAKWGGETIDVTTSIGVAAAEECVSARQMLALADRRLYEAKNGGRDRISGPQKRPEGGATSGRDPRA